MDIFGANMQYVGLFDDSWESRQTKLIAGEWSGEKNII